MSICPKNKSSKGRRDKRRANWKMSAPTLVKCSKCGELMMPHTEFARTADHTTKKKSFLRTNSRKPVKLRIERYRSILF